MTRPGKLAFVARRFHSNQAPLVAELTRLGWAIDFFSEYVGRSEDHSVVVPQVIGPPRAILPSFGTRPSRFSRHSREAVGRILAARPDIAIVRDFKVATLLLSWRLRLAGIRVVLYTQLPLRTAHYGRLQAAYHRLFARDVITPTDCYQMPGQPGLALRTKQRRWAPRWHFLPFVALPAPKRRPAQRDADAPLRILTIGKFTPRKKLVEWIRMVAALAGQGRELALTVVGAPLNAQTLADAEQAIAQLPQASLLIDHPHAEMPDLYAAHDLFVLPSIAEPASVSQLEAMAHGLPVLCSSDNGTACYVEHGVTGYVFDARDWEASLGECLRLAREAIAAGRPLGAQGREAVALRHSVGPWHAFLLSRMPGAARAVR